MERERESEQKSWTENKRRENDSGDRQACRPNTQDRYSAGQESEKRCTHVNRTRRETNAHADRV